MKMLLKLYKDVIMYVIKFKTTLNQSLKLAKFIPSRFFLGIFAPMHIWCGF